MAKFHANQVSAKFGAGFNLIFKGKESQNFTLNIKIGNLGNGE